MKRLISISASIALKSLPASFFENMKTKIKAARKKPAAATKSIIYKKRKTSTTKASPATKTTAKTDVYVLELEGGRVYVGKSGNTTRRVQQHMQGQGSEFTKAWKPTGKLLPRLGDLVGSGDGPERDETLRQMHLRGVDKVRGWRYCAKTLSRQDKQDIEQELRELHDLCRVCGGSGHLAKWCKKRPRKSGH